MRDTLNKRFGLFAGLMTQLLEYFTAYRENGVSPAKSVSELPSDTPIVFITSKADTEVPRSSTAKLAQAVCKKGSNPVYLLTLEKSSHTHYMFDNASDRDKYEQFLHAVYKQYGLEHEPELAKQGAKFVDGAKLNLENCDSAELQCAITDTCQDQQHSSYLGNLNQNLPSILAAAKNGLWEGFSHGALSGVSKVVEMHVTGYWGASLSAKLIQQASYYALMYCYIFCTLQPTVATLSLALMAAANSVASLLLLNMFALGLSGVSAFASYHATKHDYIKTAKVLSALAT